MICALCGEPVEDEDQPETAALCNSCAAYLDAKFAPIGNLLSDIEPDTPLPNDD